MTRLDQLSALGQSVWIDFLSRELIESGALARAIEQDAVVGVTSNPTIFGKALSQSAAYDGQIATSYGLPASVFHALAKRDVATACDVLRPVWDQTRGRDGYVSIEVDPSLAADTDGSIAQATQFHETIARPNLLVKIPATDAGVPAIEEMTARGYSINVTLIFSLRRHRQIAEAYLRGLGRLAAVGGDLGRVHSVASFFVSRVDSETRPSSRDYRPRRSPRSPRDRQRQARVPAIPAAVLRHALAGARGAQCNQAALPLGVDFDEGSPLPRHALCG